MFIKLYYKIILSTVYTYNLIFKKKGFVLTEMIPQTYIIILIFMVKIKTAILLSSNSKYC